MIALQNAFFSTIRCEIGSSTLAPFRPANQLVPGPANAPCPDLQGTRKCLVRPHDAPQGCPAYAKSLCGIIDAQNLKIIHFTIPIRKIH
jgi:hypothetical protein